MTHDEVNEQIVKMVKELADKGYNKSLIGVCLLGSSGYIPILKMINSTCESDYSKLGIKPLSNIAATFKSQLNLVFIDLDDEKSAEYLELINQINNHFFEKAKAKLEKGIKLVMQNHRSRSKFENESLDLIEDLEKLIKPESE